MIIIIRIHSDYEPVTVTTGAWCVNQLAGIYIFNIIIIIIIYVYLSSCGNPPFRFGERGQGLVSGGELADGDELQNIPK